MLDQLPRACKAVGTDGIDVERYTLQLDVALTELGDALPTLRSQVEASVLHAFGTRNLGELRRQMALDYEDHLLELGSYELRAFVDRALKDDVDDEAWIDGVAGLVVGKRLEGWDDTLVDHFGFEIRGMAQKLARRLALIREGERPSGPGDGNPPDDVRRKGAVAFPAGRGGRGWCVEGADTERARPGRASRMPCLSTCSVR